MRLLVILMLFPAFTFAQVKITGRVLNSTDNRPIEKASVFLANATIGNSSNSEGNFTLFNVKPGQYEVVISVIGFEAHHMMVMVNTADINLYDIKLAPKSIALKEVSITPDNKWFEKYSIFKSEFLGHSKIASKCKILNPEVLSLQYDENNRNVLTGSSDEFLTIENPELGYRIKYLLNKFIRNARTGLVYYEGSPLFEEMKGKPSKRRHWKKKRLEVYKGSCMHFLRSVLGNRLAEEGFEVRRLIRPADSAKRTMFGNAQMLVKTPLTTDGFVRLTDQHGLYALAFNNHLYIIYTKKRERHSFRPAYMPDDAPDYDTSIIGFEDKYAFFDSNGVVANPADVIFEGTWAGQRMAEMLPVDYVPTDK